jgi:hypothetical protein
MSNNTNSKHNQRLIGSCDKSPLANLIDFRAAPSAPRRKTAPRCTRPAPLHIINGQYRPDRITGIPMPDIVGRVLPNAFETALPGTVDQIEACERENRPILIIFNGDCGVRLTRQGLRCLYSLCATLRAQLARGEFETPVNPFDK